MSVEILISRQNPDGGWPYVCGRSWTEPTAYAVLALLAAGEPEPAARGIRWLQAQQRLDGGWPAQSGVNESCWATGLVALLPPEHLGSGSHAKAIQWLLATKGMESDAAHRLRQWMLGNPRVEGRYAGWPWVPGTAAWVAPTAIGILALQQEYRRAGSQAIRARLEGGRQFLLSRTCAEGGWNHGGIHDLGYGAQPYPELTGMALAALRGVNSPHVERALTVADGLLKACCSVHALNWLRLGLMAHGRLPFNYRPPEGLPCHTLPDMALRVLLLAPETGRSFFWG